MWFHSLLPARHSRNRQPRLHPALRPRLETFENRWCPSCTFYQDGAALIGRGDAADDSVAILDHETGVIDLTCNGQTQTYRGVRNIIYVDLGGNNNFDQVIAPDIHRPELPRFDPADPDVALGGWGRNRVTLDASAGFQTPDTADQPAWNVVVRTGAGPDQVNTRLGPTNGIIINMHFELGAGDDVFSLFGIQRAFVDDGQPLPSHLSLDAEGQEGHDSLNVVTDLQGSQSNMAVDANVDGGDGDDDMSYSCLRGQMLAGADQNVRLLGGNGSDRLSFGADQMGWSPDGKIILDGGNGNDSTLVELRDSEINGTLAVDQSGGNGQDDAGIVVIGGHVTSGAVVNVSQSSGDFGANQAAFSWTIAPEAMVTASQRVGNDGSDVMGWSNDLAAGATAAIRQVGGNGSRNSLTQTETIDGTMNAYQSIGNDGSNFCCWNWHVGTGGSATANLAGGKGSTNTAFCLDFIVAPGGTADITEGADSKSGSNNFVVGPNSHIAGATSFSQTGAHGIVAIGGTIERGGSLLGMQTGSDLAIIIQLDIADGGLGRFCQEGSRLQFSYAGLLDGGLVHHATGISGNDRISARYTIDTLSTGALDSLIRGGDGNDRVEDYVYFVNADGSLDGTTHGRLRSFAACAFGDAGMDAFVGTANVQRHGFER
jgi:hypothetical protein